MPRCSRVQGLAQRDAAELGQYVAVVDRVASRMLAPARELHLRSRRDAAGALLGGRARKMAEHSIVAAMNAHEPRHSSGRRDLSQQCLEHLPVSSRVRAEVGIDEVELARVDDQPPCERHRQGAADGAQGREPEVEGSPMAILKNTLTSLLKEQGAATTANLERQAQRQTAVEMEVREVLARIETKRTQDQKSARGGYAFETTALDFIDAALRGAPCVFDVTTNAVGHVDRCKKGDATARFTAESAFGGSAVVFEVKRDGGYTAQRALVELDEAHRSRDARVGGFVMAESHAFDTFPRFARHGNNVLVVWNERDAATDARFHAAIVLGLAVVSRTKTVGDDGDIAALSDIESRIEKEVERLEGMDRNSEIIPKNAEQITDEVRRGKKALGQRVTRPRARCSPSTSSSKRSAPSEPRRPPCRTTPSPRPSARSRSQTWPRSRGSSRFGDRCRIIAPSCVEVAVGVVQKIVARWGLPRPDGRPLYAYMISGEEFDELRGSLVSEIAARRGITTTAAPAFAAFVAEHYGRGEGNDWWSWDSVRAALRLSVQDHELRDATRVGCAFWKRRLLSGARGVEYLATLVCEGGLPLSLLKQEGARLRRYFGELLRLHERFPQMSLRALAAREAQVLPVRMQNDVVYELATVLVEAVARSRADRRPSQELPAALPLRLDDTIARELVEGLRAAPRAREREERGVVARTTLQLRPELLLHRSLFVPSILSKDWLLGALGAVQVPPRIYLSMQAADGVRQTVAVGDLRDGDLFVMRGVPARDIVREKVVAEQVRCIVSDGERDLGGFVPRGGEALPPTPWTFDDDGGLRSVGSVTTSAPSAVVLLPTNGIVSADGALTELGKTTGRSGLRVAGVLRWAHDGDAVRVETAASLESEHAAFMLRGAAPPALVRDADIWRGPPQVLELAQSGVVRVVSSEHLVWRGGAGTAWISRPPTLGVFEVGVRRNDEIEFRARVRIIPADLLLTIPEVRADGGMLEVRSADVAEVGVVPGPGFTFAPTRTTVGWTVVFSRTSDDAPATVGLCLQARSGAQVVVTVPLPARRVGFVSARGRLLGESEALSIDALAHVRVEVRTPRAGRWSVDLARSGAQPRPVLSLNTAAGSGAEAPLEPLRRLVSTALAAGNSLGDEVTLRLIEEGGDFRKLPVCTVRRYDAQLEPVEVDGERCVRLPPDAGLDRMVVEALRAEAVSLTRPNEIVVELVRRAPGVWSLATLADRPGPWLAIALQGDYVRTRPLRVRGAPPPDPTNPVDAAVGVSDQGERLAAIHGALEGLPSDIASGGAGWGTTLAQLDGATRLHPTTFDLVRGVAAVPRIGVLALLGAGARSTALWNALEELPFLWAAIPLQTWLTEIGASLAALQSHVLGLRLNVEEIARTAGAGIFEDPLSPFLACIHETAYLLHPHVPKPRTQVLRHPSFGELCRKTAMDERNDLLSRNAEARWPEDPAWGDLSLGPELRDFEPFVAGQPRHRRTVLRTPVVLARRVVAGATDHSPHELRRIRDFDPMWFDRALVAALYTILGRRLDRKEWPFDE